MSEARQRSPSARAQLTGLIGEVRAVLGELGRVAVCFSGGVDSGLLAYLARLELGRDAALVLTAVSPSLATGERTHCRRLAAQWDLRWREISTTELDDPRYRSNDPDRCYWCKTALMDLAGPLAASDDATVVLGVNLDDLDDHRPGQRAAQEHGARFPLVEAGFTKVDVRAAARMLDLALWDKPAAPCLASRLPYGTEVTVGRLGQIDRAERALGDLGFADRRVRHYGHRARVELDRTAVEAMSDGDRERVIDAVTTAGFTEVEIDPAGLRSGNLNLDLVGG